MLPRDSTYDVKQQSSCGLHTEYKKLTKSAPTVDTSNMQDGSERAKRDYVRSRDRHSDTSNKLGKVPFQKVSVSGIHVTGVPMEDLVRSANLLVQALRLRREYMAISSQSFSELVNMYIQNHGKDRPSILLPTAQENMPLPDRVTDMYMDIKASSSEELLLPRYKIHISPQCSTTHVSTYTLRRPMETASDESFDDLPSVHGIVDPWACVVSPDRNYLMQWNRGVMMVYKNNDDLVANRPIPYKNVSFKKFVEDMQQLEAMCANGPLRSYCYRRLSYLSSKFTMHALLNELHELALQKAVPHRDFYNIRKVDVHIHAASCMNQKHLLSFIKRTLRHHPDDVVSMTDGVPTTLKDVFTSMQLDTYDLNVDILDVHADRNTFQRFDKFNSKYNPVGESRLREVFLKTDNYMNGRYFANIIKEVMDEFEESKYTYAELRISIYCKNPQEWNKLATWALNNDVYSPHVRWMIQVPRLYDIYRYAKLLKNFQEFLDNLFNPLFEVSINPSSNPELHKFLVYVIGFDSVDDESKPGDPAIKTKMRCPEEWDGEENPPYTYYLYYMFANMTTLNNIRKEQGLNTFVLRPHCGEAGLSTHLSSAFLLTENISHGLMLRKFPVLQYLYYLAQIFIAMSPLSNNSLFLRYHRNPFPVYFARGLRVTLSSDDPLQFHFTKEALMEEYSIAAQAWKLSSCDMCEIARNSVLMSGFPHELKQHWLGPQYPQDGTDGNDITYTNVPDVRISYRHQTLKEELNNLFLTSTLDESSSERGWPITNSDIANMFVNNFKATPLVTNTSVRDTRTLHEGDFHIRFSIEEIKFVLNSMKRGKSPGHDSLSVEHLRYAGTNTLKMKNNTIL